VAKSSAAPHSEAMNDDEVTTYLPDNSLRKGYASLVRDIVTELIDTRFLTYQLFKRDLAAFYKQSLLGGIWLIVVPLVTVGTFIILRGSGVVAVGRIDAPYPVFAVLGLAVWQLFAQGLVSGAGSLVQGGDMVSRINFSKKSLVIGSMGRALVSFLVLLALAVVLLIAYGLGAWRFHPTPALALVPLALLPTALLTLGLSFYMALLNGVMRDVANALSMLVTFLMLLTPVLYEKPVLDASSGPMARALAAVTDHNPLYYLVAAPRELVLLGTVTDVRGFLLSSAVSVAVFIVALVSFHLAETRIAERI
jgi:lipopolysaccharide transport system permease protein